MSHRPGFTMLAELKAGKLDFDRDRMKRLLEKLKDGKYEITLERFVRRGSAKQRGYYHAVIVDGLAEYWGLDHDDAHELIKQHCNKKVVDVVNKQTGLVEEETIGASTAGMNVEEWNLFIARCQEWAAQEFGFVIPDPDPEWMFNKTDAA